METESRPRSTVLRFQHEGPRNLNSACSGQVFRLHALAAGNGDCLLIEYGRQDDIRRVVIDGGTAGTFPRLSKLLDEHVERKLDLLVVTHIDSDHIAGILKLVAHPSFKRFTDIWFNGYEHLPTEPGLQPLGGRQGEMLTKELLDGRPWNRAFEGKAVRLDDDGQPVSVVLDGGAKVTVLSPSVGNLAALRPRWDQEVRQAGLVHTQMMQLLPSLPSLQRMGSRPLDVDALASTAFRPDDGLPNGSSIALLFEYAGKRVVLGADAFAGVLEASARAVSQSAELSIDVFKLPHHGSQKNVSLDLIKAIPAKTYLISTNGDRHQHPDAVSIARILKAAKSPHLAFNYLSDETKIWKQGNSKLKKYLYTTEFGIGEDGLILDLLRND